MARVSIFIRSLKNNLKKTDRYENVMCSDDIQLEKVLPQKKGEAWYKYIAPGDSQASSVTNLGNGSYVGFVNEEGSKCSW